MAAAPPARRSAAVAHPARRVVLRFVARREADRRLSLAFGLLARSACTNPEDGPALPPGPPDQPRSTEVSR